VAIFVPLVVFLFRAAWLYTPSDAIFIEQVSVSTDLAERGITQKRLEEHIQSSLRSLLDLGLDAESVKVAEVPMPGSSRSDIAYLAGLLARNVAVTEAVSDFPWDRWAHKFGSLFSSPYRHVYVRIHASETAQQQALVLYSLEVAGKTVREERSVSPVSRILDKNAISEGPAFRLLEFALPDAAVQAMLELDYRQCACLTLGTLRLLEKNQETVGPFQLAVLLTQTVAKPFLHNARDNETSDTARAVYARIVEWARMRYPQSVFDYLSGNISASECGDIRTRVERLAGSSKEMRSLLEAVPQFTLMCLISVGSGSDVDVFLRSQSQWGDGEVEAIRFLVSMYELVKTQSAHGEKLLALLGPYRESKNQNLSEWAEIQILSSSNDGEIGAEMAGALPLGRLREIASGAFARLQGEKYCRGKGSNCTLQSVVGPGLVANAAGRLLLGFDSTRDEGGQLCLRSYLVDSNASAAECVALYYLKRGDPGSAVEFYENAYKWRTGRPVTDPVPTRFKGGDITNDDLRVVLAAIHLHQGDRSTALSLVGDSAYADPMWREERDTFEAYVHARSCDFEALKQSRKNSFSFDRFEFAYLIADARLAIQMGQIAKATNLARQLILSEQTRETPFGLFGSQRPGSYMSLPWYAVPEGYMIMGYAHLARDDREAARNAFMRAFEKSSKTSREALDMIELVNPPLSPQRPKKQICQPRNQITG
jgi:tetratricopeptide (TPR) repeat protein